MTACDRPGVLPEFLTALNPGHQIDLRAFLNLDIPIVAIDFAVDRQDNPVIDMTLHARIFRHKYAHQFAKRCCFNFESIKPIEGRAK